MSASEVISGHGKEKVRLSPDDSVLTFLFSDGTINKIHPFPAFRGSFNRSRKCSAVNRRGSSVSFLLPVTMLAWSEDATTTPQSSVPKPLKPCPPILDTCPLLENPPAPTSVDRHPFLSVALPFADSRRCLLAPLADKLSFISSAIHGITVFGPIPSHEYQGHRHHLHGTAWSCCRLTRKVQPHFSSRFCSDARSRRKLQPLYHGLPLASFLRRHEIPHLLVPETPSL